MEQDTLLTIAIEMLETTNVYPKSIQELKYKNREDEEISLLDILKRKISKCRGGYRNRSHMNLLEAYDKIALAMTDYAEGYPASFAFRQRIKQKFLLWLSAIEKKYDIKDGVIPPELTIKNEDIDTGITMIKALHSREGISKEELESVLGITSRAVQKNLRKICPSLYEGDRDNIEEVYTPFRIGGQPLQAKINTHRKKGDNKVYYSLENTVHPIVLQENIMQLKTLFKGLSQTSWNDEFLNVSITIGMDIWSQLSDYAKDRLKNHFAVKDHDLKEFLAIIEDEIPDDRCIAFCTEREMMKNDDVSISERLEFLVKEPRRTCTIKLEGDESILLKKASIKLSIEFDGHNEYVQYIAVAEDGTEHYFVIEDVNEIFINH